MSSYTTVAKCRVKKAVIDVAEWKCPACDYNHESNNQDMIKQLKRGNNAVLTCLQIKDDGKPCGFEFEIELGEEVYCG